jgi:hypothetical protein
MTRSIGDSAPSPRPQKSQSEAAESTTILGWTAPVLLPPPGSHKKMRHRTQCATRATGDGVVSKAAKIKATKATQTKMTKAAKTEETRAAIKTEVMEEAAIAQRTTESAAEKDGDQDDDEDEDLRYFYNIGRSLELEANGVIDAANEVSDMPNASPSKDGIASSTAAGVSVEQDQEGIKKEDAEPALTRGNQEHNVVNTASFRDDDKKVQATAGNATDEETTEPIAIRDAARLRSLPCSQCVQRGEECVMWHLGASQTLPSCLQCSRQWVRCSFRDQGKYYYILRWA